MSFGSAGASAALRLSKSYISRIHTWSVLASSCCSPLQPSCFMFSRFLPRTGLPGRHSSHPRRQARERVEDSWQKNHRPLRREPAAGGHRPDRRGACLLRDGPGEKMKERLWVHGSITAFGFYSDTFSFFPGFRVGSTDRFCLELACLLTDVHSGFKPAIGTRTDLAVSFHKADCLG